MIHNVVFDLDGVLFDGCSLHADIFLKAVAMICPEKELTREYHDSFLNALSTKQKLLKLGFDAETSDKIYTVKQKLTADEIRSQVKLDKKVMDICIRLTTLGYNIFCVSNSIRSTVEMCLSGMGVIEYFSGIISNEDTKLQKPSPEPYLTLFRICNLDPKECLILEDSPHGIESARKSGGYVLPVINCKDVSFGKIIQSIRSIE
jgi:hypothetical protein